MKKIIVISSLVLGSAICAESSEGMPVVVVEQSVVTEKPQESVEDMAVLTDDADNLKELFGNEDEYLEDIPVASLADIKKTYPGVLGYVRVALRYMYTTITGLA